jgi:hypothetical protein
MGQIEYAEDVIALIRRAANGLPGSDPERALVPMKFETNRPFHILQ